MKKLLLSVAFLSATFIGANAQAISFETSEGYTAGTIHNQNGWYVVNGADGQPILYQEVSNLSSSHGTHSLRIANDQVHGWQQGTGGGSNPIIGGIYEFTTAVPHQSISFDIFISDVVGEASDYRVSPVNLTAQAYVSTVYFQYDGAIYVQGANFVELAETWASDTWYNVKIEVTGGQIVYSINDTVVHQEAATANQMGNMEEIRFVHDNYSEAGFAYIDNIRINGATFSVEDFASNFSVYPNPATNVINVANSADVINNVTITDLNGRTVKQVTVGVNDAQINISDLAQGVYILNATSNGKSFTQKIVKQ
jgi:hypothetical protein